MHWRIILLDVVNISHSSFHRNELHVSFFSRCWNPVSVTKADQNLWGSCCPRIRRQCIFQKSPLTEKTNSVWSYFAPHLCMKDTFARLVHTPQASENGTGPDNCQTDVVLLLLLSWLFYYRHHHHHQHINFIAKWQTHKECAKDHHHNDNNYRQWL